MQPLSVGDFFKNIKESKLLNSSVFALQCILFAFQVMCWKLNKLYCVFKVVCGTRGLFSLRAAESSRCWRSPTEGLLWLFYRCSHWPTTRLTTSGHFPFILCIMFLASVFIFNINPFEIMFNASLHNTSSIVLLIDFRIIWHHSAKALPRHQHLLALIQARWWHHSHTTQIQEMGVIPCSRGNS